MDDERPKAVIDGGGLQQAEEHEIGGRADGEKEDQRDGQDENEKWKKPADLVQLIRGFTREAGKGEKQRVVHGQETMCNAP